MTPSSGKKFLRSAGKSKLSAIGNLSAERDAVSFYKKSFRLQVNISSKKNTNSKPSTVVAKHFARVVAAKID
jgi:hypothetical protein